MKFRVVNVANYFFNPDGRPKFCRADSDETQELMVANKKSSEYSDLDTQIITRSGTHSCVIARTRETTLSTLPEASALRAGDESDTA